MFKLLQWNGCSLNGQYRYRLDGETWNVVPGNGCYVALADGDGLLAGGVGPLLAIVKRAEDPTGAQAIPGVRCYRRVVLERAPSGTYRVGHAEVVVDGTMTLIREYDRWGRPLRDHPYRAGKLHGIARTYYTYGGVEHEEPYRRGKRHGVARYYRQDGTLYSEEPWENDQRHGHLRVFYPSGQVETEQEWERGTIRRRRFYYESGALKGEINFLGGQYHGPERWYYESGVLWREMPWVQGCREGIARTYYPSGKRAAEGEWRRGQRHGFHTEYCESGVVARQLTWVNGRITREIIYDESGECVLARSLGHGESASTAWANPE